MGISKKQSNVIENADARWNLLTGAVRSGKTHASLLLLPKRLKELPDGRRAIIGKTETTIMRNILDPLRDMLGDKYVGEIQGRKREVEIFGKRFYCIGANDARAEKKLRGAGFQYVLADEVTVWPKEFFNMLKSRLDKKNSIFDGTCNPEGPYHWLKSEMLDRQDELDIFHQKFTIDDNPFLSDEFVRQLKKEYQGVWHDRYIKGLWVLAEGLVYDMFDTDKHVIKSLPEEVSIRRSWVGVDYGTSNATAFVLIGYGSDGNLYILDEYKHEGSSQKQSQTDSEYSQDLIRWLGNELPKWIAIDPSAKSFRLEVWRQRDKHPAFKNVVKANNEVLEGIRKVSSLLSTERLYILDRCEHIKKEMTLYSWDSKAQEKGEDKPIKKYDHLMDAIRYAVSVIPSSIIDSLLVA